MGKGLFTRNYDNIMTMARFPFANKTGSTVISIGENFVDGECVLKDKTGLIKSGLSQGSSNSYSYNAGLPFSNISSSVDSALTSYGYTSIFLGSNNTEETYDDYTLLKELTMLNYASADYDFLYSTPVCDEAVYDAESKCWRKTVHYVFVANRPCTVGEMGFYYALRYLTAVQATALVYRRAFETPYELVAGDTFRVDFTLVIPANPNQPMAVEVEATAE